MGDRALIQFQDSRGEVSPVCYLHCNGSEAPIFIAECAKLMQSRPDDVSYAFARFVGICHTHIEGNLSLGVFGQDEPLNAGDSHGDAGCYLVDCSTWDVEAFGGYGTPFNAMERSKEVEPEADDVAKQVNGIVKVAHGDSSKAGWWTDPETGERIDAESVFPVKLCLIHSEISEAMEGHRKGLNDDHLPHRKMAEVELADALIRIADLAGAMGYDLGGAVREKLAYNRSRSDHKLENRAEDGGKKY